MSTTIEQANDAKRQLLELNEGVKGLPLIKSVTVVLGDEGFRLEAISRKQYRWDPPEEINGVKVVWTQG